MLRQGPLPAFVHGVYEYLLGAWLIAAPFVLPSTDGDVGGAAVGVSVVLGLLLIALTASSRLPTGLVRSVPVPLHVVADLVLAAALVAAPFALGFRSERAPTAASIVVGVLHLLVTIATRFPAPDRSSARSA